MKAFNSTEAEEINRVLVSGSVVMELITQVVVVIFSSSNRYQALRTMLQACDFLCGKPKPYQYRIGGNFATDSVGNRVIVPTLFICEVAFCTVLSISRNQLKKARFELR
jgi:hypothetical protein